MKKLAIVFLAITAIHFSANADFQGYTKATPEMQKQYVAAILLANGNNESFGACDLGSIAKDGIQLYIQSNDQQPLFKTDWISEDKNTEYVGNISTDAQLKNLVSLQIDVITYSVQEVNKGTIAHPVIVQERTGKTESTDCKP